MGIVFKNISSSAKGYKRIYLTLIISQIISVVILLFAYGIFGSFNLSQKEYDYQKRVMYTSFTGDEVYMGEIRAALQHHLSEKEEYLQEFIVLGGYDSVNDTRIRVRNSYKKGKFSTSDVFCEDFPLIKGRNLTEYEMNSKNNVAISASTYSIGSKVRVGNTDYEIVGIIQDDDKDESIFVSLDSVPDDYILAGICFNYNKYPTVKDYEDMVKIFETAVGRNRVEFSEFEPMDNEQIIAMKSIVIISVIIGIISALDTALLYRFIMEKRKKQMAIMGIVGAKKIHRILINETEIMILTAMTSTIGYLIFRYIFEGLIQNIYKNMVEIYYPKIYVIMLGIYIGGMLLITSILTISTSGNKFIQLKKGTK